MSKADIYLYIFSGPHLGAKIAIKEGKHIIGSDDGADIILYAQNSSKDFAIMPKHALLTVSPSVSDQSSNITLGNNSDEKLLQNDFLVTLHSIEGAISLEHISERKDELTLEQGKAFYLSSTCMAWNYPDVIQESLLPQLAKNIKEEIKDENNIERASSVGSAKEDGANSTDVDANNSGTSLENLQNIPKPDGANSDELSKNNDTNTQKSIYSKIIASVVLAFLLVSLSIYFEPENQDISLGINALSEELLQRNFEGIEISHTINNGQESILLKGFVNSDEERQEIQTLARSLQYPVYLDVKVQNDFLRAVKDSFALSGINPYLELKNAALYVSAYIKNSFIEEVAFANLTEDIKPLPQIERKIVYEPELALLIDTQLQERGIRLYQVVYANGTIQILGIFDGISKRYIHEAVNAVTDILDIPLNYTIADPTDEFHSLLNNTKTSAQDSDETSTSLLDEVINQNEKNITKEESRQEPLFMPHLNPSSSGGLKISSVHTGHIPFITTQEGQRLFEGALLPSGYSIEEIKADMVLLKKGSQELIIEFNK